MYFLNSHLAPPTDTWYFLDFPLISPNISKRECVCTCVSERSGAAHVIGWSCACLLSPRVKRGPRQFSFVFNFYQPAYLSPSTWRRTLALAVACCWVWCSWLRCAAYRAPPLRRLRLQCLLLRLRSRTSSRDWMWGGTSSASTSHLSKQSRHSFPSSFYSSNKI